jgi:hypothetical protein
LLPAKTRQKQLSLCVGIYRILYYLSDHLTSSFYFVNVCCHTTLLHVAWQICFSFDSAISLCRTT